MAKTLLIDDKRSIKADKTVRTLEEGIEALKEGGYDWVLLDDHLTDDISANEGEKILEWLKNHPNSLPKHIVLVTDDPKAHKKMQKMIDEMQKDGDEVTE